MAKILSSGIYVWVSWTLVTAIGFTLGFAVFLRLGPFFGKLFPRDDEDFWYLILVALFMSGLLISFGQWVILRMRFTNAWPWILATTMSLSIGIPLVFYIYSVGVTIIYDIGLVASTTIFDNLYNSAIIPSCFAGLIIGVFQRLSIRAKFSSMLIWILVSILSWGIGISLPLFFLDKYMTSINYSLTKPAWFWIILGVSIGGIVGVISGIFVKSFILDLPLPESNFKN